MCVVEKLRFFGKLNGLVKCINWVGGDGCWWDIFVYDLVYER